MKLQVHSSVIGKWISRSKFEMLVTWPEFECVSIELVLVAVYLTCHAG